MDKHWCGVLLVAGLIFSSCGQLQSEGEDDWIDPGDMLNYDSGSKKMVNKAAHRTQAASMTREIVETCNECDESSYVPVHKHDDVKSELERCLKEKEEMNELETDKPPMVLDAKEGLFFRQYVRSLLLNFQYAGSYQTQITLSESDRDALNRFANMKNGRVEDAHHVLHNMADYVKPLEHPIGLTLREKIENVIGIDLSSLFMIIGGVMMCSITFSVIVRIHVPWTQIIWKLFVTLFVISIPWNWWYLYKNAVASRQADLLKDVPPECNPGEHSAGKSLFQWITSPFTFSSDECTKYHQRLLVDPFWEVPPTQAVAITVTKFFLEPLRHVGVAIKHMIRGLLEDMPIHMWPVVLLIFVFLTGLILVLMCGYRIKLFWNIFGLEPGHAQPPQPQPNPQAIQQPSNMQPIQFVVQGNPAAVGITNLPVQPENIPAEREPESSLGWLGTHRSPTIVEPMPTQLPQRSVSSEAHEHLANVADTTNSVIDRQPPAVQPQRNLVHRDHPSNQAGQSKGGKCLESSTCESLQVLDSLPTTESDRLTEAQLNERPSCQADTGLVGEFTAPDLGETITEHHHSLPPADNRGLFVDGDGTDSLPDSNEKTTSSEGETTVEEAVPSTQLCTEDLNSFEFLPELESNTTDVDSLPIVEDLGSTEHVEQT